MNQQDYDSLKSKIFHFLWEEIDPILEEVDNTRHWPHKKYHPKFRELGLWGLMVPEPYGGSGLSVSQYLPILAELAKVGAVPRGIIHVHNTAANAIATYGTEEQKKRYLPKVAAGESSVAFSLTEVHGGSGMDVKSTAVREGDYYILNGEKHLITNADFADLYLTCCWTDKTLGRKGLSALLVHKDAPGFTIEQMPHLMGGNGSGHGILTFRDLKVPCDSIVGQEGDGLDIFLGDLEPSRVFVAASSLGVAERSLEIALDYAKNRVTFGKPIATRQAIQALLANMAKDVYALKVMLADVSKTMDRGERCPLEASACKLFGCEAVIRVTDMAMEVLGGRAYVQGYPYPFERLYREARVNTLEEGTPSIQRLVMARRLLQESLPLKIGTLD